MLSKPQLPDVLFIQLGKRQLSDVLFIQLGSYWTVFLLIGNLIPHSLWHYCILYVFHFILLRAFAGQYI